MVYGQRPPVRTAAIDVAAQTTGRAEGVWSRERGASAIADKMPSLKGEIFVIVVTNANLFAS
jgi:hypothetical protein